MPAPPEEVPLDALGEIDLYLPRPYNIVRKLVDEAFMSAGMVPRVVAEIESAITLTAVVGDGLGATILPESMARMVVSSADAWQCRIVDPTIGCHGGRCVVVWGNDYHPAGSELGAALLEVGAAAWRALPGMPAGGHPALAAGPRPRRAPARARAAELAAGAAGTEAAGAAVGVFYRRRAI
jgi:DNA-binding transcriptional LysR family regulator